MAWFFGAYANSNSYGGDRGDWLLVGALLARLRRSLPDYDERFKAWPT